MKILIGLIFATSLFSQTFTKVYAGGISANPNAGIKIAGTGLFAQQVKDSNTYAFAVVDALPTTIQPFIVTTQFSGGIAQKILTINNIPIFIPTSAGVSYNGTNVGWAWTTGGLASVRVKGNWLVMPNLRLVKSSVSNGTGYQVIAGLLIGWGQ